MESCGIISNTDGKWSDTTCSSSYAYVCETKVIEGNPYCVDRTHNYLVIAKNTTGTTNDEYLTLAEVSVYDFSGRTLLTGLISTLSTTLSGTDASLCLNGNLGDYCSTNTADRNSFLVIDTGQRNFDKIVITTRSGYTSSIVGATMKAYHRDTLLQTWTFSSASPSYTFVGWNGGT